MLDLNEKALCQLCLRYCDDDYMLFVFSVVSLRAIHVSQVFVPSQENYKRGLSCLLSGYLY